MLAWHVTGRLRSSSGSPRADVGSRADCHQWIALNCRYVQPSVSGIPSFVSLSYGIDLDQATRKGQHRPSAEWMFLSDTYLRQPSRLVQFYRPGVAVPNLQLESHVSTLPGIQ